MPARKTRKTDNAGPMPRDAWQPGDPFTLEDGRTEVVPWVNVITNERVTLRPDVHPMDNPNALAVVNPPADDPDDGGGFDPSDDGEQTEAERIAVMLGDLSGSSGRTELKIYRQIEPAKGGGTEYCGYLTPQEFEMHGFDAIRERFGAGRFVLMLYGTIEGNKFVRLKRTEIRIAEQLQPAASNPAAPASVAAEVAKALAPFLERIAPAAQPQKPFAEQITEFAAIMKAMQELTPKPAAPSPVNPLKELAETIKVMRMLREEVDPPAPKESDDLMGLAREVIGVVKATGIPAAPTVAAGPMLPLQVPAVMAAPAAVAENPAQVSTEDDEAMMQLKMSVMLLNARARKNADPEESAQQVADHAPDELLELLQTDQWFETLAQMAPEIVPFRDWYAKVRDRALVLAFEPEEDETPAAKP